MADKDTTDPKLKAAPADQAKQQDTKLDQTQPGGHYIVDGKHVDANGNELNEDGSQKSKDGK